MITLTLPDGTVHFIENEDTHNVYRTVGQFLCGDLSRISGECHMIAAEAEGWTELACVGETYESQKLPGLTIEIEE